jgi:hypothetical protein
MTETVTRCRSCGYEQLMEFDRCPVCHGAPGWWCGACVEWRSANSCSTCGGMLHVAPEVNLGAFPSGSLVPFRFEVRNPGKKPIDFSLYPGDVALTVPAHRRTLRPAQSIDIAGTLALGPFTPGRRTYKIRFDGPVPCETELVVEIVPALVRLEFIPPEIVVRYVVPGSLVRREVVVKNTGNVPIAAMLMTSDSWLTATPAKVGIAVGATATLKVAAKTRKSEHGERVARVKAVADDGRSWDADVRIRLPAPELEAAAVNFGEVQPGRAAFDSLTLRNMGKVRVACTLTVDQPWLAVTPKSVNLPPGREKVLKLRALIPEELAGKRDATVAVSFADGELLRVPVAAVCKPPKPILGPIRRQTLAAVATDAAVIRRFRVANTGDGRLVCTITADVPWVQVLTSELSVGAGKKRRVEFRIDSPNMQIGKNTAVIRIHSNGGNAEVPLSLTVVEPDPGLELLGNLDLGTVSYGAAVSGHLSVRNGGVGLLQLQTHPEDSRVTVSPAELALSPGPPAKVSVSVAVAGLDGGPHAFGVRFSSNGGTGRAEVRFRLPVELVEVPALIDLGDQAVGRSTGDAIRVRNTGQDRVALRIAADNSWVHPVLDRVIVKPGAMVSIPFQVNLAPGVEGPLASTIRLEGHTVRHAVAVRVVAKKVDLVASPPVLALGGLIPGEEREVVFQVVNKGEVGADVRASHSPGELEVWIQRRRVPPGETATMAARVKMNAQCIGMEVRTVVDLGDELVVRFTAQVASPTPQRLPAGLAAIGGMIAGLALGATIGWLLGIAAAAAGFVVAGFLLAKTKGQ